MGNHWTNLEVFDIGSNRFNGTLPTNIGLWTNLREFSIETNAFSGPIPSSIVNWTKLDAAYLQNNELTGTVPEGVCTALTFTSFVTEIACPCCMNTTLEPTPSPPFVMDVEMYIQSVADSAGSSSSQTMDAELAAIEWLIYNNEVLQLYPYDPVGQFRLRQRYGLLTLYFATQTAANPWISDEGWLDEPDECLWKGVTCTEFEPEAGLGNQFVVEGIVLSDNGLHGKLSPDLSLLSNLKYFEVSGNRISGTLPSTLGDCGGLLEFKIHNNTITGTLPHEYGTLWTDLYSFSAWDNELSGSLPSSFGNLTALTSIDLDANNISGSFPSSICNWHNMEYFYFAENSLTGLIPDSFANSTPFMKHFGINGNAFTGTISSWYGASWTDVEVFNVADNMFVGMIPESLYDWPLANTIDFSGNALTGTMPLVFCNFVNVTYLAADAANVTCTCCDCCGY
jgi:Leucine-rich repeat (LRR) protein